MTAAARLTDPITHTGSLMGMIGGLIAGAVVGALLVTAEVVTGGLATVAIVGLCAATGGGIGAFLGSLSFATSVTGNIVAPGSANVIINFLPAARAHLDMVLCSNHCPPPVPIAQGSDSVFINFMPAARVHDMTACSGVISQGSPNVFIGGGTKTTDAISPEIPRWLSLTVTIVGVASAAVLFGPAAALLGFAGGMLGGELGNELGGKLFGEGSDGQKITAFAGSLLGGAIFGKAGGSIDEAAGTQGLLLRGGGVPSEETPGSTGKPGEPENFGRGAKEETPPASEEQVPPKGKAENPPPNDEATQQARQERLDELSKDPDHGNAVSDGTRAEAEAAMGAEEGGDIPGPVRRPQPGDGHSGDFVDGEGNDWDVKAPRSRENLADKIKADAAAKGRPEPKIDPARPLKGEYDTGATIKEIQGELAAKENVLVDTRNMNAADLANLRAAVESQGLGGRVKFWP